MLNAVIGWSLRNRLVVLLAAAAVSVLGALSFSRLELDAFPDTTNVQVQVNTQAPSLAPEEVERQITFPVEQAMSGLPRVAELRSISRFGLSQVVAVFEDGTDVWFARQQVAERLGTVELPEGIERPAMGPVATGLGEVFHYLVKGKDLARVRTAQDWILKPALHAVPGVAEVNSWGGYERQVRVRVDPVRLLKHGLGFAEVAEAVRDGNRNVGGGSLDAAGDMLLVHGVGRAGGVEDVRGMVIASRDGVPIRVGDVADVAEGHETRLGVVTAGGEGEAVLGLGFMVTGGNSHEVTTRLKERLAEARAGLPPGVDVEVVYDRTVLVDDVLDTVRRNLFEGGLLVVAVLFAFLGRLRAGLIVAAAIPFSMLFAATGMLRLGIAGSLLSLGAIDFGLVVDSSVILVENAVRHLARGEAGGRSRVDVVREAALEVRRPTLFGELIILVVYLPVLTLEGVEGRLFRPMALTVALALLGSLVLSLTVVPALASLLLPRRREEGEPLPVRAARALYAPVLRASLRHRGAVLGGVLAILLGTAVVARGLGSEFVPRLSEGSLVVNVVRLAGTSIEESVRRNTLLERALLQAFPDEIARAWSRTGTAEVATDPMGVELTDVFLALRPRERWKRARDQAALTALVEREIRDMPGQRAILSQPIEMRINEMLSGLKGDVAVKLLGDDLAVLQGKAREVEAVLRRVPGCADLAVEQVTGQPVLRVRTDPAALARHGVRAAEVLAFVEAMAGIPAGEILEGQVRVPLVVSLPEEVRGDPAALGALLFAAPSGERVPLSRLARIERTEGPSTVTREWGRRRVTVQCNVRGRDMGGFVEEARRAVAAAVRLPPDGTRIAWGGQFENLERARLRLAVVVPGSLALVFALLYLSLRSVPLSLLVFTGVPLAVSGGVAALWVRGMPFSIPAAVGFIALSGVAVLNGLVMITFIRQLRHGGAPLGEAVVEGSLVRLRPVLMTALVASLGFVPMAAATGMGAEVQKPLATVVIGGVLGSTLLTLVVLPVLYGWFEPRAAAGEAADQ